jgi:mannosyltransferase OCH1-like enzyme
MIPKIIHYCWFGGNPLSELEQKCIASWKKYFPMYEIKEWNEQNFDINIVPFTAQVAKEKKWGFIVDYIRGYVVYYYGGIYLDTDVELLKPFDDDMLQNTCFSGFEDYKYVNPGNIFAGEKGSVIAKNLMDFYSSYNFIQESGELNLTPSPEIFTKILLKYGLKKNNCYQELGLFTAYSTEYFCPMSFKTGKMNITENTYSIHHFKGSWYNESEKIFLKNKNKIYSLFGDNLFSKNIIRILNLPRKIMEIGFRRTLSYYYKKIIHRENINI